MASAKRLPNEAMPPPNSKDQREFLKQAEAQRRAEEAAAAERRRKAAARGAASSDAKLEQAVKDKEQTMKDKQMREAYERVKPKPFRKGGNAKKYAEGGDTTKPEKKSSGFKDLLGTLSPLYGMMSGKGLFGKNDIGLLPALARRARKKRADGSEMTDAEETVDAASSGAAPPTMRRGGSVKKYASGGMPDLTGDGKVTRADVLKGRGVFKRGGDVKKYASGGSVSSASKRADGCATKGKTRGKFV